MCGRGGGAPLVAGVLLGLVISFMMGQFLGARHGAAPAHAWAFGAVGVALAGVVQLVLRRACGRWDPFLAGWVVAITLLVAFFPIEAGNEFSLWFAVDGTTLALWCAAAIVPSIVDVRARAKGAGTIGCHAALMAGLVMGAVVGGPVGYAVAFTPAQGVVVYASAIASMVTSFLVLIVVLGRPHESAEWSDLPGDASDMVGTVDSVGRGRVGAEADIARRCRELAVAYSLTPREAEVLEILARGYDLGRVQEELGISEGTALTHKRHVYQKLAVHARAELLDLVLHG